MPSKGKTGQGKKSERTRRKIVDNYLDLMSEKKWDRISVKELCQRCQITRGTFYQYYNDIYDMMEQIENMLLDDLTEKYKKVTHSKYAVIPAQLFYEKFDYSPHGVYRVWFEFVENNKKAVFALIDRNNGDAYFVQKLKNLMTEYINRSMDNDGLPRDELRSHFMELILEMHFHSAQIWIANEKKSDTSPTIDDIVHLLNNTRVGACYINHKQRTDPDFDKKMQW